MKNRWFPSVLFWAFCLVVLSKIAWYDFRVYVAPDSRRAYLTLCFALWTVGQIVVFIPVISSFLRELSRKSALIWCVAVTPYLALGILQNGFSTLVLGDIARYSLPLGYLLFGFWAVRNVAARTMLWALTSTLALLVAIRTVLHWLLGEGSVRYGVQWEVMLSCLLIALALVVRKSRYIFLLIFIALVVLGAGFGQTRSVLSGTVVASGVLGLISLVSWRWEELASLRMATASGLTMLVALLPMVLPLNFFQRISVVKFLEDSSESVLSVSPETQTTEVQLQEIFTPQLLPAPAPRPRSPQGPTTSTVLETPVIAKPPVVAKPPNEESVPTLKAPVTPLSEVDSSSDLDETLQEWQAAIGVGGRSLDVRFLEATYFLKLMAQTPRGFFLGSEAGQFVIVETPGHDRIVRGAHSTYVTLLYRHGVLLGLLLCWFVTFYGLPTHIRQLVTKPRIEWRVLLLAFVGYRIAVVAMAQFHQGLFDDPLVFLSMAVAVSADPSREMESCSEGTPESHGESV